MPWTLNGCGTTSEFVELLNFGPGPIDISCYILTDGDYAITFPQGTIFQPGEFYVIAGQDIIPGPCANIDSTIQADLNWNTCGCTSDPIPTTGDGFFTDGGSANEQVVLLDPSLNVVDAVIRDLPAEPSSDIRTNTTGCGAQDFNLANMSINYEVLGMSAGRGNSFARKLDGDCGWVKDPQQSANATNNTPSDQSDISYTLSIVNALDCSASHGSIEIYVEHANYSLVFPMNYTIAYDTDNDGVFEFTDEYTYGVDSTPPSIFIDNLVAGRYRITISSVKGCYLENFDFTILPCYPVLPVKLINFKYAGIAFNQHKLVWTLGEVQNLKSVIVEKSTDGRRFELSKSYAEQNIAGLKQYTSFESTSYTWFRLKMVNLDNTVFYSPVLKAEQNSSFAANKIGPNPAKNFIQVELSASQSGVGYYAIHNNNGSEVQKGQLQLRTGMNAATILIDQLPAGIYHIRFRSALPDQQPISFRFVKQ